MTGPYRNSVDEKTKINSKHQQQRTQATTKKKRIHDDFSDLMDYVMLDTIEREKHRLDVDRIHPVIEKNVDSNSIDTDNPTIGDIKKIKPR